VMCMCESLIVTLLIYQSQFKDEYSTVTKLPFAYRYRSVITSLGIKNSKKRVDKVTGQDIWFRSE
jgi:hypothetical protein